MSLAADNWVLTPTQPEIVSDLEGVSFDATVNGTSYPATAGGFTDAGTNDVYTMTLTNGMQVHLTGDHEVLTTTGKKQAQNLVQTDRVVIQQHKSYIWGGVPSSSTLASYVAIAQAHTSGEVFPGGNMRGKG